MKSAEECQTIDEIRSEIDRIDRGMVEALAERAGYVQSIMRFKQTTEEIQAPDRQQEVILSRREWAIQAGISPDLAERIFRLLIDHFVSEEINILSSRSSK